MYANLYRFRHLLCPLDGTLLVASGKQLACEKNHTYDIAKEGYANLLGAQHKKSKDPGDTKQMIAARRDFLNEGHYMPIVDEICEMVNREGEECARIVDAGCGDGYYLQQMIDNIAHLEAHSLIGFDISKWAIIAAAKRNAAMTWLVASSKQDIVAAESQDLILSMFGFNQWPNFARMLKPNGGVLLVDSGSRHLVELREVLYPTVNFKPVSSVDVATAAGFSMSQEKEITFEFTLPNQEAINRLLLMTPHLYRAPAEGKANAAKLTSLTLTGNVVLRWLTKC